MPVAEVSLIGSSCTTFSPTEVAQSASKGRSVNSPTPKLLALRRLHVLLYKPTLNEREADEAELLARRLNYPIRRYRLQLDAPEAGWQDITK